MVVILRMKENPELIALRRVDVDSELRLEGNRVWVRDDEIILSGVEYGLFSVLWNRGGALVFYDDLIERVWGPAEQVGDLHKLHQSVKRLRTKLPHGTITTRTNLGYGIF